MMGNLGNRRGRAGVWILAVVVIVLVVAAIFYFGRGEPEAIGAIGMLGAPPQTFEPLYARGGIEITDNQRALEFNDGSRIIAETGTVLNLGTYREADRVELQSGLIYHEAPAGKAISVAAGPLDLSSVAGRMIIQRQGNDATVDVLAGRVNLATREVAPGLTVIASGGQVTPTLRRFADKTHWIGRLVSDPGRVRPDVADTHLPGKVSGMVIVADTWAPRQGALVRLFANTGDTEEPAPTTTDAQGRFAFPDIFGAEWLLLAKAPGMINLEEMGGLEGDPRTALVSGPGPHLKLVQLHPASGTVVQVVHQTREGSAPAVGAILTVTGEGALPRASHQVRITEAEPTVTVYPWPDRGTYLEANQPGFHAVTDQVDTGPLVDRRDEVTLMLTPDAAAQPAVKGATGEPKPRILPIRVRRLY